MQVRFLPGPLIKLMFFSYVLNNSETGKLYKGHTQDLQNRLKQHNSGKTKTTKNSLGYWKVVYQESFESREEAINREKYYKSAAGRKFFKAEGIHQELHNFNFRNKI